LIFPAPKAGYTHSDFKDKLIYIPKFSDWQEHKKLWKRDNPKLDGHQEPKELDESFLPLPETQFASPRGLQEKNSNGEVNSSIMFSAEGINDDVLSISVKDPENDNDLENDMNFTTEPKTMEDTPYEHQRKDNKKQLLNNYL